MNSVKEKDCFICAYAEVEQIPWSKAKRHLKKFRTKKDELGVCTAKLNQYGLKGYKKIEVKDYKSIAHAFKFKPGILGVSWGHASGYGHAVAWNGYKVIDNIESTISNYNNSNFSMDISIALVKEDVPKSVQLKNMVICSYLSLKSSLRLKR